MPDQNPQSTGASPMPVKSSELGTETVTITVGRESLARRFVVHRDLISNASDFFRVAFTGAFKEAEQSKIDLPEEHPAIFEAFIDWLYFRRFQESAQYDGDTPAPSFWLRVYAMANRHLTVDLQKHAFRQVLVLSGNHAPAGEFVAELFNYNFPKKALENYFIRQCAFHLQQGDLQDWKPWSCLLKCHETFGIGVAVQVAKFNSENYHKSKTLPSIDMKEEDDEDDMETDSSEDECKAEIIAQIQAGSLLFEETIKLPLSWTIAQFKATVQAVTGIPASKQHILEKDGYGYDLEDERTLASYNIQNKSELEVLVHKLPKDWRRTTVSRYL